MCIRDRYLTNAEINAIANGESFHPVDGNGEKSENQFVRMDKDGKAYYAAVSYTHLDVYKRQDHVRLRKRIKQKFARKMHEVKSRRRRRELILSLIHI